MFFRPNLLFSSFRPMYLHHKLNTPPPLVLELMEPMRNVYAKIQLPSHHHNSSLRIRSRREAKRRAIDHSERVDAVNFVLPVDHLPHLASAVVMPNGQHHVLAVLIEVGGVVGDLSRSLVHDEVRRNVNEVIDGEIRRPVLGECFGLDGSLDGLQALHADRHILRLGEVVEGDGGILVGVAVLELEVSARQRPSDLLHD